MSMAVKTNLVYNEQNKEGATQSFMGKWIVPRGGDANWLIFFGLLEVILGILAIGVPLIAGIAASMFLGGLLFLAGVARVIRFSRVQSFSKNPLRLIGGLLGIGCGLWILAQPLLGLEALTLLLMGYLLLEGLSCISLSFNVIQSNDRTWLLIDGILTTLLAVVMFSYWPISGVWLLGTLLGIDLLITGIAAISIGFASTKSELLL